MGSSQSTRKLSLDNENVIQLSQEALERLQSRQTPVHQPSPAPSPLSAPNYDQQITQKEYASEEAYWSRRIENLKRAHDKAIIGMQTEYQKTLNEANELYARAQDEKISGRMPPCEDEKAKVIHCYSVNPGRSLMCATVVNEFRDCVSRNRLATVSTMS